MFLYRVYFNILPSYFIKINKSFLANEHYISCFKAVLNGSVNIVFKCGYIDYDSRRCFKDIKRRYEENEEGCYSFFKKGVIAYSMGPIVLVVVYLILKMHANSITLTIDEVCIGIISLMLLAFISRGMNVIYQIEKIPLVLSVLIHGIVLYIEDI